LFSIAPETAPRSKRIRVLECSEKAVPPGNVTVIEIVDVQLMMDRMMLGTLDRISGPARRFRYRATLCPDSPWVFCTKGGLRVPSVRSSFWPACDTAGLSGFRFHDLRHTCGSWLMQAGVPAGHIAAVLGHSTIRMTERYAHVAPENAQAAVAKLEECTKIYTPRNDNVEVLR
jgi:hypothetical protein